jgi:hypothetical protein
MPGETIVRNHVFSWLFIAGSVLWGGCHRYRFVPPVTVAASAPVTPTVASAPSVESVRAEVGVAPLPPCEVRMEVYNADKTVESGSICIKRSDQSFRFPFPIFLKGDEGRVGRQFNGMCLTAEKKELEPDQAAADKVGYTQAAETADEVASLKVRTCDWTRLFRDAYPLTFKIYTEGRKLPLGQFARTIRVFRNGKLVFSWKNENTLAEVVIPGSSLTARLMPFGAPIDLRIIPTTSPEDPRVITKIDESIDPLWARINTAKTVLLAPIKEGVAEELACLQWLVGGAEATAQEILGRPAKPQGAKPTGCEAPKGNAAALHERLRQSVLDAGATVDRTLDEEIARLGKAYGDRIREAAAEAKQKLSKHAADAMLPNGHSVSSTVAQIDDLATAGATIFDELNRSIRSTVADAKKFARDRDAQARQLAAVTEALELQGSAFDPYTKNPELVEGEMALDMRYGDKFQWFTLAPWHGVPFRVTGNAGADINLATAIPILDLIGFRYQWGTGRSTSFRTGLGFLYFQDENTVATAGTTASTSASNVAAELNVGWAGMVFGAGYVLNHRSYDGFVDVDRVRLIIGADLLKIFGNRNAEVPVF